MPWHLESDNPGCSGWAVVKDADGSIAGCHPTQADAQKQMAALYANEPAMTAAIPAPVVDAGPDPYEGMAEVPCYGAICIEGVPDGGDPPQEFAAGSLEWAALPLSLKWQEYQDENHDGSCVVGRMDQIWRDGALIRFVGVLDNVGEKGREVIRQRRANFVRWLSICADDIQDQDIEYVMPPAPPPMPTMLTPQPPAAPAMPMPMPMAMDSAMPSGGPMPLNDTPAMLPGDMMAAVELDGMGDMMDMDEMCEPIKVIIHAGRIRSATIVAESAFPEATFDLGESPILPPTANGQPEPVMVAAAVAPHSTRTSDATWDGPANEKRLPSPMPVATARAAYAFIDDGAVKDGQVTKEACRFIHHEVSADGSPGPANIKACQTGIGVLNGGRGGTNIPGDSKQGVYNHLAGHIRDASLEPPPLTAAAGPTIIAAGSWSITIPELWPESWFEEPSPEQLATVAAGAVHITPEGRVWGLLAPDGVNHRAFRGNGERVRAPRGIDYSEWQNKGCIVAGADGGVYKINAGTVTFNCGHASPTDPRRADPSWASQHYDNSCSVAMRARVGENRFGTWFAGGLTHGLTASALEQIMGCALSGDWQGGKLKAALLVPCEGFPVAVTASVRERMGTLVASSVPIIFEAPTPEPDFMPVFDLVASAIARDRFEEMAAARFAEIARERG